MSSRSAAGTRVAGLLHRADGDARRRHRSRRRRGRRRRRRTRASTRRRRARSGARTTRGARAASGPGPRRSARSPAARPAPTAPARCRASPPASDLERGVGGEQRWQQVRRRERRRDVARRAWRRCARPGTPTGARPRRARRAGRVGGERRRSRRAWPAHRSGPPGFSSLDGAERVDPAERDVVLPPVAVSRITHVAPASGAPSGPNDLSRPAASSMVSGS